MSRPADDLTMLRSRVQAIAHEATITLRALDRMLSGSRAEPLPPSERLAFAELLFRGGTITPEGMLWVRESVHGSGSAGT